MESSKTVFCSSKYPRARERISSKFTDNLDTRCPVGSPPLPPFWSEQHLALLLNTLQRSKCCTFTHCVTVTRIFARYAQSSYPTPRYMIYDLRCDILAHTADWVTTAGSKRFGLVFCRFHRMKFWYRIASLCVFYLRRCQLLRLNSISDKCMNDISI